MPRQNSPTTPSGVFRFSARPRPLWPQGTARPTAPPRPLGQAGRRRKIGWPKGLTVRDALIAFMTAGPQHLCRFRSRVLVGGLWRGWGAAIQDGSTVLVKLAAGNGR